MSTSRDALMSIVFASDLMQLASEHLDSASMDVMDDTMDVLGHAFMGSLTTQQNILETMICELKAIVRDIERQNKPAPPALEEEAK